jgi:hypothetical protein
VALRGASEKEACSGNVHPPTESAAKCYPSAGGPHGYTFGMPIIINTNTGEELNLGT